MTISPNNSPSALPIRVVLWSTGLGFYVAHAVVQLLGGDDQSPRRLVLCSQDFDPYYKWFGIAPEEQPPNHYRLLGIRLFEADSDVIANAADQRMAYPRNMQVGRHRDASQRLLDEIAAARCSILKRGTAVEELTRMENGRELNLRSFILWV